MYFNDVDKNLLGLLTIIIVWIWIKSINNYRYYDEIFGWQYNTLNKQSDNINTGIKRRMHTSHTREIRARHSTNDI